MNAIAKILQRTLGLSAKMDEKLNRICECSDIHNTPLFKYIERCSLKDKERLVEKFIKSAQIFTKYLNKTLFIEIFKDAEIVLDLLFFKGIDILWTVKMDELIYSADVISKVEKEVPTCLSNVDKINEIMDKVIGEKIASVKFTGLEIANAIVNYFKEDKKSKIQAVSQKIETNGLFIMYFIIQSLYSCGLDRFADKYTFKNLSRQGCFKFDHISKLNEVVEDVDIRNSSPSDQYVLYMTGMTVNATDCIDEEDQFNVFRINVEIIRFKDSVQLYMEMFKAKTSDEYHLARAAYYK